MGPYWEDATPITFAGLLAEEWVVSHLSLAMKCKSDVNICESRREGLIHRDRASVPSK
jgi:hypothetical protein